MSFTKEDQCPGFSKLIGERDSRYGISHVQKKEKRAYIEEPEVHNGTLVEPLRSLKDADRNGCRCR